MNTKSYSELIRLPTFDERFEYLKISGIVGEETFGRDRYLNQALYHSNDWKRTKRKIIIRDNGCDLGCTGYDIIGNILIHHINPITMEDILEIDPKIFDLDNLICVSLDTHNAIHYGMYIPKPIVTERHKNDTCPWKHD